MRAFAASGEKPLYWVASSLRDMQDLPKAVQFVLGDALRIAQNSEKSPAAKPWKGEGLLEIISDYRSNTIRAIYTVRFANAVYVLHVFQKKSPKGTKTRRSDSSLVGERLKMAQRLYEEQYGQDR